MIGVMFEVVQIPGREDLAKGTPRIAEYLVNRPDREDLEGEEVSHLTTSMINYCFFKGGSERHLPIRA